MGQPLKTTASICQPSPRATNTLLVQRSLAFLLIAGMVTLRAAQMAWHRSFQQHQRAQIEGNEPPRLSAEEIPVGVIRTAALQPNPLEELPFQLALRSDHDIDDSPGSRICQRRADAIRLAEAAVQLVKRGQSARALQGSNLFTGIGGRFALACIHEATANIERMRDALDSAILLDPGFPEPRRMRAALRRREEDFPGAVEDYSVFLRACPDDLDAREACFEPRSRNRHQSAMGASDCNGRCFGCR
ncbi:MAG: hypothetical protein AAB074_22490 [Planctomycetota bacterium]